MKKRRRKYIGYEKKGLKSDIFGVMLKSIIDFTIPDSFCKVYYTNKNGKTVNKTYFKQTGKFYVNGDRCVFQSFSKKRFEENLTSL